MTAATLSDGACDGCEIVSAGRPTPGGVIVDDPFWHVTHVGEPAALVRGMLVLRLKRHVIHLADLSEPELIAVARLVGRLSQAIRETFGPERTYCTFFGEGSPHAHFVLIPRYADMPAGNPVASLTEIIVHQRYAIDAADAADAAALLREALRKSA